VGNILCGTNSTADTKLVTSHRERMAISQNDARKNFHQKTKEELNVFCGIV